MPLSEKSRRVFQAISSGHRDVTVSALRSACKEAGIRVIPRENGNYATLRWRSLHTAVTDTNGKVNVGNGGLKQIAEAALAL